MNLAEVLDLAVKYRATRVKVGDIEVELSPSAFAPLSDALKPQAYPVAEEGESCPCGHAPFTEHSDEGLCLFGCAEQACEKKETTGDP